MRGWKWTLIGVCILFGGSGHYTFDCLDNMVTFLWSIYISEPNVWWWGLDIECLYNLKHVCYLTLWGRVKCQPYRRRHFPKHFLEWSYHDLTKISLKFVPKCPINNIPTLVQIMAWRQPGAKPLSEPMLVRLLTHVCIIRYQWFNFKTLISATVYQSGTIPNLVAKILATNFGNHLCMGYQNW